MKRSNLLAISVFLLSACSADSSTQEDAEGESTSYIVADRDHRIVEAAINGELIAQGEQLTLRAHSDDAALDRSVTLTAGTGGAIPREMNDLLATPDAQLELSVERDGEVLAFDGVDRFELGGALTAQPPAKPAMCAAHFTYLHSYFGPKIPHNLYGQAHWDYYYGTAYGLYAYQGYTCF